MDHTTHPSLSHVPLAQSSGPPSAFGMAASVSVLDVSPPQATRMPRAMTRTIVEANRARPGVRDDAMIYLQRLDIYAHPLGYRSITKLRASERACRSSCRRRAGQ